MECRYWDRDGFFGRPPERRNGSRRGGGWVRLGGDPCGRPSCFDAPTAGGHKGPRPASAPPPPLRDTGHGRKKNICERPWASHRIRAIVSMVEKMRMGTISALYWKRPLYMPGLELSRLSASVGRARMRIQGASRGR